MDKNSNKKEEKKDVEELKTMSPVDQWMGLYHQLNLHKRGNLILSGLCGLLIVLVASTMFQDPVVAIINEEQRVLLKATRKAIPVGEKEIQRIVKEFVRKRYQWDKLDPKLISENVSPLVTRGLKNKLYNLLMDLKENGLQGKKASQKITDVDVTVTEKSVLAHFDKVLRVEGIPLIVPTGLSLMVVKGARTVWNPEGVYINGVLENANK